MAKKKTTRKKKARPPSKRSKAGRAASGATSRKTSKKPAPASRKKKTGSRVRAKAGSASKRAKPVSSKKKSAPPKKHATAGAPKQTAATGRTGAPGTTVKPVKPKASTPVPPKAAGAAGSRVMSGKSHASVSPPERKPGMLDPMPAHPNDAVHALSTPARLTRKQLNHFRDLLLRRRAELIGDVRAMEFGALRGGGSGDSGHAPMHMADAGSDTFDQEFALQLAATERELLDEIDKSLEKIANGTFGICEVTGKPISLPRLEAKPWAKVCIEIARERDRFHRFRH